MRLGWIYRLGKNYSNSSKKATHLMVLNKRCLEIYVENFCCKDCYLTLKVQVSYQAFNSKWVDPIQNDSGSLRSIFYEKSTSFCSPVLFYVLLNYIRVDFFRLWSRQISFEYKDEKDTVLTFEELTVFCCGGWQYFNGNSTNRNKTDSITPTFGKILWKKDSFHG